MNARLKKAAIRDVIRYALANVQPPTAFTGYTLRSTINALGEVRISGSEFELAPTTDDVPAAQLGIGVNAYVGITKDAATTWMGQIESFVHNTSSVPSRFECKLRAGSYGAVPGGIPVGTPVSVNLWGGLVPWHRLRTEVRGTGTASDAWGVTEKGVRDALASIGASGWVISTTAPSNPIAGNGWYDVNVLQLKMYDGSNWLPVWAAAGMVPKVGNSAVTAADDGATWVYQGTVPATFTLIAGAQNRLGFRLWVLNNSTQPLTLVGAGSNTVNGGANFVVKAGEHALCLLTATADWTVIPFGLPDFGDGFEVVDGQVRFKLDTDSNVVLSSSGLKVSIPNATNQRVGLVELTDNTERANRTLDDHHVMSVADTYWAIDNAVGNALVERNYGLTFDQSDMLPGATDGEFRLVTATDQNVPLSGSLSAVRKLQIGKRQWPDGADIINSDATTSFKAKLDELVAGDTITIRLWNTTTNEVDHSKRVVATLTGPPVYTDVSGTHATDGDYYTIPCTAVKHGTLTNGVWWQFELDHNFVSVVGSRVESPLGITRGLTTSPETALVQSGGTIKRTPIASLLKYVVNIMPHFRLTRDFVTNLDSNTANEAITSTDNTAVFGVTDFVGLDVESDGAAIRSIRAGDWMCVHADLDTGEYAEFLAEVAGYRDAPNDSAIGQIWYKTPVYSYGLNQYRQIGPAKNAAIVVVRSVLPLSRGGTGVATLAELQEIVQQFNEPRQLTGNYVRKANGTSTVAGEWDVNTDVPDLGTESGGNPTTALLTFRRKNADVSWFASHWIVGAQLQFGDRPNDYVLQIVTNPTNTGQYWTAGVQKVAGTIPNVNAVTTAELRGFDPHRTEFAEAVWDDRTPNIDGKGGTVGQIWTRGTTDKNAAWTAKPVGLPDQDGHGGQWLKSDGTDADWAELPAVGESATLVDDVSTVFTNKQWKQVDLGAGKAYTDYDALEVYYEWTVPGGGNARRAGMHYVMASAISDLPSNASLNINWYTAGQWSLGFADPSFTKFIVGKQSSARYLAMAVDRSDNESTTIDLTVRGLKLWATGDEGINAITPGDGVKGGGTGGTVSIAIDHGDGLDIDDDGKVVVANPFTDADETKLDGIAAGAEANVQSNWNEADTSSDAFIQNKPTIPTVPGAGNGLDTSGGKYVVKSNGDTISVSDAGVKVADGEIGTTQLDDEAVDVDKLDIDGSYVTGQVLGRDDTANSKKLKWVNKDAVSGTITKIKMGKGVAGSDVSSGEATIDIDPGDGIEISPDSAAGKVKVKVGTKLTVDSGGVDIKDGGVDADAIADQSVTQPKLGISDVPASGQVITWDGSSMRWRTPAVVDASVSNKTANYTVQASDKGSTLRLTGTTARTFTFPDAGTTIAAGWWVRVVNDSTALLTLAAATGEKIDGADSITVGPRGVAFVQVVSASALVTYGDGGTGVGTLTETTYINWDLAANQQAKVTLTGNRTLNAPTNGVDGRVYTLEVHQDGTGSRTLTFASTIDLGGLEAPTLTTDANKIDLLTFMWFAGKVRFTGALLGYT